MKFNRMIGAALCLSASSVASAQFGPAIDLAKTVVFPDPPQVADLDGDGDGDVVVLGRIEGRLLWFENLGSGELWSGREIRGDLDGAEDFALGDFDGDGRVDVVILVTDPPSLLVSFNRGEGLFDPPAEVSPLVSTAWTIELADLSGDGYLDVIVTHSAPVRGARVYWSDGQGGVQGSLDLATSSYVSSIVPIDLDADGDLDLVGCGQDEETLWLFSNEGQMSFADPVVWIGESGRQHDLAAEDVDQDGDVDVYTRRAGGRIAWFSNEGGGIPGTTHFFPSAIGGHELSYCDLLDLDLDGDMDVVASGFDRRIFWSERQSNGSLFAFRAADEDAEAKCWSIVSADVDGDGHSEVLTSRRNLAITVSRGGNPAFPLSLFAPIEVAVPIERVSDVEIVDLDSDGDLDIIGVSNARGSLTGFLNDGNLENMRRLDLASLPSGVVTIGAADFDGDGVVDIVTADSDDDEVMWLRGLGDLEYAPPVSIGIGGQGIDRLLVVDLDADGDPDVAFAAVEDQVLGWFENLGTGAFSTAVVLEANRRISVILSDDIDDDGHLDLCVRDSSSRAMIGYFGLGQGAFSAGLHLGVHTGHSREVTIFDIDGDGLRDLINLDTTGGANRARWWRNDGDRTFSDGGTTQASFGGLGPREIGAGDVNRDGVADVLIAREPVGSVDPGSIEVNHGVSPGPTFADAVLITEQYRPNNTDSFGEIRLVDLDGDLDLDLVFLSTEASRITVQRNTTLGLVGSNYCGPAVVNATGQPGESHAAGSTRISEDALTLFASHLTPQAFGLFLTSRTATAPTAVPGSIGSLCLGGFIGRAAALGQVLESGPSGQFHLRIPVDAIPTPTGPVAAQPGETWYFQAWHRDISMGAATSNFTDAIQLTFE